jgi:hypothetical protein
MRAAIVTALLFLIGTRFVKDLVPFVPSFLVRSPINVNGLVECRFADPMRRNTITISDAAELRRLFVEPLRSARLSEAQAFAGEVAGWWEFRRADRSSESGQLLRVGPQGLLLYRDRIVEADLSGLEELIVKQEQNGKWSPGGMLVHFK